MHGTVALSHYDGRVVAVCHSMWWWWWCWASVSFEAYWRHCRRPEFALDNSMQQCLRTCDRNASYRSVLSLVGRCRYVPLTRSNRQWSPR